MGDFKEKKIKLVVAESTCASYEVGDTIYIERYLLDKERSAEVCLTALSAIYPFIYAARKGVTPEQMGHPNMLFQCPDCDSTAVFRIVAYDGNE